MYEPLLNKGIFSGIFLSQICSHAISTYEKILLLMLYISDDIFFFLDSEIRRSYKCFFEMLSFETIVCDTESSSSHHPSMRSQRARYIEITSHGGGGGGGGGGVG